MKRFKVGGAVAIMAAAAMMFAITPSAMATTTGGHSFGSMPMYVQAPDPGALTQEAQLLAKGDTKDALALQTMMNQTSAVWLNGTTGPIATQVKDVQKQIATVLADAKKQGTMPLFSVYNIPGRDCSQYSGGGAASTADYETWIQGVAQAIGSAKAVLMLETDSLGNEPSDCATPVKFGNGTVITDADREGELSQAVDTLEQDPNVSVYLDGTNSGWKNVGDSDASTPNGIARRLIAAGVEKAQGFFLNISNYYPTLNNEYYGSWISKCIASVQTPGSTQKEQEDAAGACPGNLYWNGGPSTSWNGVALNRFADWQTTQAYNTPGDSTSGVSPTYVGGIQEQYNSKTVPAGAVVPHFIIDTSRNGQGFNDFSQYGNAPYNQSADAISALQAGGWCNNPGAGLGTLTTAQPKADAGTGADGLIDAYLWAKTPGQSDGACDSATRSWDYSKYTQSGWPTTAAGQKAFDPIWGQVDPAAGAWFDAQALQLIQQANPKMDTSVSSFISGPATSVAVQRGQTLAQTTDLTKLAFAPKAAQVVSLTHNGLTLDPATAATKWDLAITAAASGQTTFTAKTDTDLGSYSAVVEFSSAPNSSQFALSTASFTVTPAAAAVSPAKPVTPTPKPAAKAASKAGSALSETGTDLAGIVIAAGLLLAGAGALFSLRRRVVSK